MTRYSIPSAWSHRTCSWMVPALAAASLLALAMCCDAVSALDYNRDIRPILAESCFACHGPDSVSREADLRLDQRDAAIDAGAITEGNPDESEMIARIFSDDTDLVMPPEDSKKTLSEEQKEILKRWIAQGAEYQPHWSFIAPQKSELPAVRQREWTKNVIDRFVLAKLEACGLSPASEADPRTLIRRLSLDIVGLPPKPEEVAAFVKDYRARGDEAFSDWIDKLMDSVAWGEHRARYWLDAARYADTHGMHFDNYREMWPYRDWVIHAFNANQPFDQFTLEQIAGDLLPDPTDNQLIATGFQRCNITTSEGGTIVEENLANYAADRVQTLGWVYLGLTTNCSQCHDHKFDRFTMKDYYSLAAFFRNTTQGGLDGNKKDGRGPVLIIPCEEDRPRWKKLQREIADATVSLNKRMKEASGDFQRWLNSEVGKPFYRAADKDPLAAGLVVHLPLNDGGGDQAQNLVNGSRPFKSDNEVEWIADGKFGPVPVLQQGATFGRTGPGNFEKHQKFSYGAWIRSARKGVYGAILAHMDEKANYRGWDLWQNDGAFGVHLVDSWPNNAIKVLTRNDAVKPGQWQHVFVTYDGSGEPEGIKIYLDGKEEALEIDTNTLKSEATIRIKTKLRIGQRNRSQVFEDGSVQDVRIYSRVLHPEEIQQIGNTSELRLIQAIGKRTPEQQALLREFYLSNRDPQFRELSKAVADRKAEYAAIKKRSPITHIQEERKDSPAMAFILTRGQYDSPAEEVAAATPAALHPMPKGAPANRLGLAEWIVDPANPLTARVTVNRFWQEVFGQGIVTTPENFGVMGSLPSHPQLLDWLAVEFRESGWDVKRFFKMMLTSATYRQAAITTAEKLEKDPENVLLSRGPRFRMDAEMVRDHALATSGLLSRKKYGPGAKPYQPEGVWDVVGLPQGNTRDYVQDSGQDLYRRTIYSFWKRMAPPPNLEAFNAPSREVCTVCRERTNTPLQALVTLNAPQFVEAARYLAEGALTASEGENTTTLDFIAQHVLCRSLSQVETTIMLDNQRDLLAYYRAHPEDAEALIAIGESEVADKLEATELAAWTIVCNQILNLDEALNK